MKLAWMVLAAERGAAEEVRAALGTLRATGTNAALLADFEAYLYRSNASLAVGASATSTSSATAPPTGEGAHPAASLGDGAGDLVAGGFRTKLERGRRLQSSGDLNGAESLYREVLQDQPGNVEALTGLADVSQARGDRTAAEQRYEQALEVSPYYLPAMMGRADVLWSRGERQQAIAIYRTVVERLGPTSSWGRRAAERIDAASPGEKTTPAPASDVDAGAPAGGALTDTRQ